MPIWINRSKEFDAVPGLAEARRYEHFVKRAAQQREVWGLWGERGWIAGRTNGKEFIPVWSAPEYAERCALGTWGNATPRAMKLSEWLEEIIPALSAGGKFIAVFPTPEATGMIVEPERLAGDLRDNVRTWSAEQPVAQRGETLELLERSRLHQREKQDRMLMEQLMPGFRRRLEGAIGEEIAPQDFLQPELVRRLDRVFFSQVENKVGVQHLSWEETRAAEVWEALRRMAPHLRGLRAVLFYSLRGLLPGVNAPQARGGVVLPAGPVLNRVRRVWAILGTEDLSLCTPDAEDGLRLELLRSGSPSGPMQKYEIDTWGVFTESSVIDGW